MAALIGAAVLVVYAGIDGDVRRIVSFSSYGATLYHGMQGRAQHIPGARSPCDLFVDCRDLHAVNARHVARCNGMVAVRRDLDAGGHWHGAGPGAAQRAAHSVGLEASRSDTRNASDFYYAPQELNVAQAVLNYTARASGGWTTTLEAAAGQATDPAHGDRASARAEANLTRCADRSPTG